MYHMENTKIQSFSTEEAISSNQSTDRGERAPFFLSTELQACAIFFKYQATSGKRQAASGKLQASSQRSCKQQALNVVPIIHSHTRRLAVVGE